MLLTGVGSLCHEDRRERICDASPLSLCPFLERELIASEEGCEVGEEEGGLGDRCLLAYDRFFRIIENERDQHSEEKPAVVDASRVFFGVSSFSPLSFPTMITVFSTSWSRRW